MGQLSTVLRHMSNKFISSIKTADRQRQNKTSIMHTTLVQTTVLKILMVKPYRLTYLPSPTRPPPSLEPSTWISHLLTAALDEDHHVSVPLQVFSCCTFCINSFWLFFISELNFKICQFAFKVKIHNCSFGI